MSGVLKSEIKTISTTMFTNQPISMCHRGVMKLIARHECKEKKKAKYCLIYRRDLDERTLQEVFQDWFDKEVKYRSEKDGKNNRNNK
jgi:hypothetical protein